MLTEHVITTSAHVLRPHPHLFSTGIVAVVALTTPLFAVFYWLGVRNDTWPIVLGAHVAVLAVTLIIVGRYRLTAVTVSKEGLHERSFFGRENVVSNNEIGSITLIEVYRDSALDTQPNLFVIDTSGRLRIRLRGQFWSRESMEIVADVLERPTATSDESIALADLRSSRPELLYWFERTPVFAWL